jgi:hypothetical protein
MKAATAWAIAIGLTLTAATAEAQTVRRQFEAGATIATICLTSSSYCGTGQHWMPSAYGSYWLTRGIEIGARVSRIAFADVATETGYYLGPDRERVAIAYSYRNRSRTYVTGHVYRHFGSDPRIHLFTGVGLGRYFSRETTTCTSPDCGALRARLGDTSDLGTHTHGRGNLTVTVGLSGQAGPAMWRAGLNCQNLMAESTGGVEYFTGVGVRF